MTTPTAQDRDRIAGSLARAVGSLSNAAMLRMESTLPWFRALSAQDRSWVGLIVQAGIRGFVDWWRTSADQPTAPVGHALASAVFGAAPRELAGIISLEQTVDLVRLTVEVVESDVGDLLPPGDAPTVHEAVMRYAREVAFATAEVYARAAEARGAWDARLEALVVDGVLRGEGGDGLLSRASAVGWGSRGRVCVVLGLMPLQRTDADVFSEVRRIARDAGMDALCATQGERLVVVLGGVGSEVGSATLVTGLFGDGPVVVGPVTPDLASAHLSARAALTGLRAARGWPQAPRPVTSEDLLPERVLAGDDLARRHLVEHVYAPLEDRGEVMLQTLAAFVAHGSIEGSARALFVHPNTVRYRLRQVAELTGLSPTDPRESFTLQIALTLGQLSVGNLQNEPDNFVRA